MTSIREEPVGQGRIWVPRLLDGLLVLPIQIAAVAYLAWVARPSLGETGLLLALFLTVAALAPWLSNRRRDGVFAVARGTGPDEASTDRAQLVLRAAESEARRRAWTAGLVGLLPILTVPLASWALGFGAWTEPILFRSLAVMAGFASVASATTVFCWTRQRLAWLDDRAVESPSEGADEATSVSSLVAASSSSERSPGASLIPSFESLSMLVPAAACLMILLDASSHDARRTAEEAAIQWAEGALAVVAAVPVVETETLDDRVRVALPEPRLRPASTRVFESDVAGRFAAIPNDAFGRDLARARRENPAVGSVRPPSGDAVGAYQQQADGRILVVRLARAELAAAGVGWGVGVVGFLLGVALLLLGSFAASDRRVQVEVVESRLRRLAKGDLRARLRERSFSEFASLDPLLLRIRERMRRAVLNSRVATEEVDLTVGAVAHALAQVETTSLAQAAQMSEARELLSAVLDRFGAARRSTDELTEAIDESSHSVHELGAAGDELKETASVLTSRVEVVSDSLEQMVASVKQVGATSEQLAEASEETSSSMEEMASAMRAVDTSAETTANLSRDVVEKAELGQAKVVQTIAGMEAIRDATDVAERVIRGLGARTSEIGGILDVIEDVADETNLLALNAAIIAAQAGEQGKAFSVVADEIKELADRVLASTKEIADLIRAVQNESENAIGAIEAGSASVMSGVDLSAEAGRTLEEITEASRESGTRIGEIVNSVREQTKAASHVVSLMERVRDSADQIGAAGAEQDRGNEVVYRSALTMREVAQQVHRTTEDQAAGFGRIRANVEGVRGAVDEITEAMQAQLEACGVMSGVLERAAEGSRSNEGVAEGLREALTALSARTARCKEDAEEYRL